MEKNKFWYLKKNGQQIGPLPEADMLKLWFDGQCNDDDLVWTDGMSDWKKLKESELRSQYDQLKLQNPFMENKGDSLDELNKNEQLKNEASTSEKLKLEIKARPAGFWIRLVAFLIDSTIIGFVTGILQYFSFMGAMPMFHPYLFFSGSLISFIVYGCYYGYLQSELKGTLGKKALGIVLVNENYKPVNIAEGLWRQLLFYLVNIFLMIGSIWVAFDDKKQALYDRILDYHVVYANSLDDLEAR